MAPEIPAKVTRHACDLCGSLQWKAIPVPNPRDIGICGVCGFVYVRDRRPAHVIASDWGGIYGEGYNPDAWPAVRARLHYVREWIVSEYKLNAANTVLDIGAGTGTFIGMLADWGGIACAGLEPSDAGEGHSLIKRGSVEDDIDLGQFDFVTINWTLENCHDPIKMLDYARKCCKPDGKVIVATGSRILVPYKKPLSCYLGDNPPDLHCFRWSRRTLEAAMRKAGLWVDRCNPYMECDWLVMSGTPISLAKMDSPPFDPPADVDRFFTGWAVMWP
jgi:SAM-dependent methyltransferase